MRYLLLLAVFISFAPSVAQAQTYYNAPSGGSSSSYNGAGSNYSINSGPLNLKSMVKSGSNSSRSKTGYTYKGKPYGVDRTSYSLALSPEQARQNNIKRQRAATAREREKAMQKARAESEYEKQTKAFYAAENANSSTSEADKYLRQFQGNGKRTATAQKTQRKNVLFYNKSKNSKDPVVPKRVFNTPY